MFRTFCIISVILISSPLSYSDQQTSFSNRDLGRYQTEHTDRTTLPITEEGDTGPLYEEESGDFPIWCAIGAGKRQEIEIAGRRLEEAEKRLKTAKQDKEIYFKSKGKKGRCCDQLAAETEIENAKLNLKEKIGAFSTLEKDAEKKGINRKWLHCLK